MICRTGRAPRRVLGRGPNDVDDSAGTLRRRDRPVNCSFSVGDRSREGPRPPCSRAEASGTWVGSAYGMLTEQVIATSLPLVSLA